MLGDMRYMSPERTRSNVDVDSRSDIYELGAVIYALLTGRPPFEDKSVVETVRLVRHAQPEPPKTTDPSIPDEFQDIVLRMLAKSPDERFANPDELLKELEVVGTAHGVAV